MMAIAADRSPGLTEPNQACSVRAGVPPKQAIRHGGHPEKITFFAFNWSALEQARSRL